MLFGLSQPITSASRASSELVSDRREQFYSLNESALRLFKRVRKREVKKAMRDGCNVPEKVWKSSLTSRTVTERGHCRALEKDPRGWLLTTHVHPSRVPQFARITVVTTLI